MSCLIIRSKLTKKETPIKLIRTSTVPQSLNGLLKGQLKYLSEHGFEVVGISAPGEALRNVEKREGVRTVAIDMKRHIDPIQDFKSLWQLYRFFKKEKPTLVHSITPKAGLLSMLAAKFAGVPIRMHTFTGLIWPTRTGVMRNLLIKMDQALCWATTHIYPEGQGVKNDLVNHKITHKPLKVIANGNINGIDTKHEFNPALVSENTKTTLREDLGILPDDFMFLFVGRVVSDKGINELVQAFQELATEFTSLKTSEQPIANSQEPTTNRQPHLVIVGNYENHLDPLKPETERLINEHPYIHAVGYKTNVIDYFASADVLTFPSYREGFPNVVMQAAAMQLNAIVSDINGCNEIITNGENGWIVPSKNVTQLKEKMLWCVEHRKESKEMGLKNRKLMQEKYEREYVWKELLKEYNTLLNTEDLI